MTTNISFDEIYPRIAVYNNLFKDSEKMYRIAKQLMDSSKENYFPEAVDWYIYGKKAENAPIEFDRSATELVVKNHKPFDNLDQEDQYYFATELVRLFHLVNNDYAKRYGIALDNSDSSTINTKEYGDSKEWHFLGPAICMYDIDAGQVDELAMKYHTDYILEPMKSPGYKFVITTTIYLNDDYEGGDLDFMVDNKLINYKPKRGDFVVFPSGHPDYLTEDGNIYLHSVKKCYNNKKYFVRMFWQKYSQGSEEWYNKEKEFGEESWSDMYKNKIVEYREQNPQRSLIQNGMRVK